ncbi:MAG: GAF domain-containing protein [Anaerolineae bacterium]|nr:GAF domain-containing protein [Anaerolineae bacterium]
MAGPEPTTTPVESSHLYEISRIVTQTINWNTALDRIVPLIRSIIIFDNLAVYLADPLTQVLDVMYARAVGRGRSAEADIAWGEDLATAILDKPQVTMREPVVEEPQSRLDRPFILGIPLKIGDRVLGAVVFIRFGGPPFSPHYVQLAEFIAQQISLLVERQNLQRAYERLEAESAEARLQEDFISTITHELRTPLGFIKGYTTTLLRSDTTWDQPTQDEFLKIIDQETDRLQDLIENLLDSARLQSGNLKMDFQAVRIDTLVRSVIERTHLHHPNFVAQVEMDCEMTVIQGDPKRIGQVLDNIFSNALKYAPGSEVWVKINCDDNEMWIDVEDNGPGIPQRYLAHLFERFFRNPDIAPSVHGSGLGLFICKKIMQAHGGSIQASSIVGQGTTFQLRMPKKQDKSNLGEFIMEES